MLQQLKQTTTAWNESFLSTTIEHRAPARKPDRKGDNVSPSSIPEKGACQSKWSQKQVPFGCSYSRRIHATTSAYNLPHWHPANSVFSQHEGPQPHPPQITKSPCQVAESQAQADACVWEEGPQNHTLMKYLTCIIWNLFKE